MIRAERRQDHFRLRSRIVSGVALAAVAAALSGCGVGDPTQTLIPYKFDRTASPPTDTAPKTKKDGYPNFGYTAVPTIPTMKTTDEQTSDLNALSTAESSQTTRATSAAQAVTASPDALQKEGAEHVDTARKMIQDADPTTNGGATTNGGTTNNQ